MIDTSIVLAVLLGVIVIGVMIYRIRTGEDNVYNIPSAFMAFRRAEELVETYAPAAEQLYKIGQLPKEQRLDYVIAMVLSFMDDLDTAQIRGLVEGWVNTQKQRDGGN